VKGPSKPLQDWILLAAVAIIALSIAFSEILQGLR
jgi:hypothetical protein